MRAIVTSISFAVILISLYVDCTHLAQPDAQELPPADQPESSAAARVVGEYYKGDGLGVNLYLSLNEDRTFRCLWRGCLGVYGECHGSWSLVDNRIVTQPSHQDGMFERRPVGDLEVVKQDGKLRLVQSSERDFFDNWGATRYACFHRTHEIPGP